MGNNEMKKLMLAIIIAGMASLPAHAISEKYRQQLEREHKTQVQDANQSVEPSYVFADKVFKVIVNDACRVKKVNGLPPAHIKQVTKNIWEIGTRNGATLSVKKLGPSQCDITWTDTKGKYGILKVQ